MEVMCSNDGIRRRDVPRNGRWRMEIKRLGDEDLRRPENK